MTISCVISTNVWDIIYRKLKIDNSVKNVYACCVCCLKQESSFYHIL